MIGRRVRRAILATVSAVGMFLLASLGLLVVVIWSMPFWAAL